MSILNGKYLTLAEAAERLPGQPSVSTLHRWRTRGVNGVKLTMRKIGGRRAVKISDLEAFIDATTAASDRKRPPATKASKQQSRRAEAAEAALTEIGIICNQDEGASDSADNDD